MRILIYGGSFNPPHLGHTRSVQTAIKALAPDTIFLIPASIPPHKALAEGSPLPEDRLAMTALAAQAIPSAQTLDMELFRPGKSYTADTLRQLRADYPEAELIFLLGTDMLLSLDMWHEPETVMGTASIGVFAREDGREEEIRRKAEQLRERFGAKVYILAGEPVTVSSTQLRAMLPERCGEEFLDPAVYAYIIRKRLYGAKPSFVWLREQAYAYLKPKRVPHVQGTEQEAVRLAQRWGEDTGDAAEAAICHDITKKLTLDEQLRLCDKYGIMADTYETTSEKLLHAKTGAAFAADLFGLPPHIAAAICWHTTGRAQMTTLQQIIYLADYIEPGRDGFAGLSQLRKAAYEDLDAAMELGTRMSLAEVSEKGQIPHVNTVQAHDWFLRRLREKGASPVQAAGIPDAPEYQQ